MCVGLAKCELLQIWLRRIGITTFPILFPQQNDDIDPHESEVNHVLGTGRPVLVKTVPRQISLLAE